MRKMIAFQKMLVTMLFPTCYGNSHTKSTADENLFTLFSVAVYLALIRTSSTAYMIGLAFTLFSFLYKTLVRNAFVFQLPVKRSFTISGIYIFSGMFNWFSLLLLWAIFFLFMMLMCITFFFFHGTIDFSFIDTIAMQEEIVVFSFFLLYANVITPTLLLKRKSSRIIGITAVSVLYCIFTVVLGTKIGGGNLLNFNFLGNYLRHIPNGWLFIGACLLVTAILSIASIWVAEFIE
ncbi:MAG: hypothetical protein Q8903_14960, partial [Bacteroidota bacterium]|nr:hypothetical protein [Bacteroidota bacterium]